MNVRRLANGSVLLYDRRGSMQFFEFGRGVVLHVTQGLALPEHAKHVIDDGQRMLEKFGRCVYMVDTVELRMITTEFRESMADWLKKNKTVVTAHILVRSKLVEMAITVINLVVGGAATKGYAQIAEWEAVGRAESGLPFHQRPLFIPEDLKAS